MNNFFRHIRSNIIRGLLAVIPLLLCAIAVTILYKLIDKRVMVLLKQFIDIHFIPGLGTLLVLAFLFLVGLITSNVFGRQIMALIENISARIPMVREIYSLSKQVGDAFTGVGSRDVFKRAVMVNYPGADQWMAAFVTGKVKDQDAGEEWLKVYVPMAHPLIGFVCLVKEENVRESGWSPEEVLKMVVSFGILSPKKA